MTNKFVTVMEAVGRDALKALAEIVKYLPAAAGLAAEIFPAESAAITGVVNSVDLIPSSQSSKRWPRRRLPRARARKSFQTCSPSSRQR